MTSNNHCPVCKAEDAYIFIEIEGLPVYCNHLSNSYAEAVEMPRGDVRLAYCCHCGHIFNAAFDPREMDYSPRYENSLHFSARFQQYASALAGQLVERYDLHHKKVVEIGSGQGDFLALICKLGQNQGIGFDPSYRGGSQDGAQIEFIQDYYSEKYAHIQADLVCSRQTLEHIYSPSDFVSGLRQVTRGNPATVFFFEVPNGRFLLNGLSIWDIIYEHYSIFSRPSLQALFARSGFRSLRLEETFAGQYLTIEALACKEGEQPEDLPPQADLRGLQADVDAFKQNFDQKIQYWRNKLLQSEAKGRCAVVWGAGSKGVTFLNVLNVPGAIRNVVDINPRKRNKFIAGSGHRIVAPEDLRSLRPDLVLVMNKVYQQEIRSQLDDLGLKAELMAIHE